MTSDADAGFDSTLRTAGLRRTPVRAGVLKVLAAAGRPLDVPSIVGKMPQRTDAVTVYRTLNTFTRKKLVHRVRGDDRSWRYAIGRPDERPAHQHPHFVCDECGKVDCMTEAKVPAGFVRALGHTSAYAVLYAEVVLHGRCPRCR